MLAKFLLCLVLGLGVAAAGHGAGDDDLVVVANGNSGVVNLTRNDLINLYMGRINRLPSGRSALPLDFPEGKEEFYLLLVDKSLAEINSYWARLVFSGRASPPRQAASALEVLEIVASNRGAIGYVRRGDVDDRVVILTDVKTLAERVSSSDR